MSNTSNSEEEDEDVAAVTPGASLITFVLGILIIGLACAIALSPLFE